ncbi:ABC transporter substrate-binding protein [Butyrivibrio sp. AC2005]|uniref:ABC transporter substrate-binding protein n=1 Tax=Butyrivibrio sp. AC2005 TaxID=1280672 RepID=UPI00041B2129|nr:extracellular solute-binding protein [Butyrivibrio sp. AC2005]
MRKGQLAKVMAIGLVCSMAFSSACGKKSGVITEGGDRPAKEIDKDHVYSFESVDIPAEGDSNVSNVCAGKDSLYATVYNYNSESGYMKLYKIPFDTVEPEEVPLDNGNNVSFDSITCDDEGNIYASKYVYSGDDADAELLEQDVVSEENTDEEKEAAEEETGAASEETGDDAVSDEDYTAPKAFMVKMNSSGETLWESDFTEEDSESYIRSMVYAKGYGVLTCSENGVCLYDENTGEGKIIYAREKKQDEYYDAYLFRMKNDDVYLVAEDGGNDTTISKFNPSQMTFDSTDYKLPEHVYGGYGIYPGTSYDFYNQDNSGIYGFNLGDEKTTKIVDFTASNEVVNMVNFIGEAPDGRLVITNSSGDESCLSFLSKVDPSKVEEKEIITLGTCYIADTVRKQVVKFNKNSDKYKINIIDYAELAGEEPGDDDNSDEYMTGINKLSLDITQGKAPDIIAVESDMPFESYALKGAIEPLDPYFDTDDEISATDYLSNVFDASKINGKIYSIIPSFYVTTCVVSKDNAKGDVITIDNYEDICKRCGIDPILGMGMTTRSDARQLYETMGSAYVNYEEGTCSFDSESFVKLLEFIKELPNDSEDMDYETYEAYYRENKSLLKGYWLSSFEDYQVLKKGYFGKDIVFNGFPAAKDGRSYITPNVQIAMSSDCKNKQAVWEFMKSFLSDEYQENVEWSFPIERKAIDKLAEKAQEKPYYIDSNGKKVENTSIWSIGGMDVEIEELSKEETDTVVDFIESVTTTQSKDDNVINIIDEEAAAFYEGQKSAEEVADIIQSRVSIYLSEQM